MQGGSFARLKSMLHSVHKYTYMTQPSASHSQGRRHVHTNARALTRAPAACRRSGSMSAHRVGSTTGSRRLASGALLFAMSDSASSVIEAGVIMPRGESAPVSCAVKASAPVMGGGGGRPVRGDHGIQPASEDIVGVPSSVPASERSW